MGKKFTEYVVSKKVEGLARTQVRLITGFTDEQMIQLAEKGAQCFVVLDDDPYSTRKWLEEIHSVLNHGVCTGCLATALCYELSKGEPTNGTS